jgi:glycogen debranching enzyme
MNRPAKSSYLNLLRNEIDITKVPFSERGSRLLVFKYPNESSLYVKLAERLLGLDPGLEAYLKRPPFIQNLTLIDQDGQSLEFDTVTHPNVIYLDTELGVFKLVYQDNQILSFGLPPKVTAGIRFLVTPYLWQKEESGGTLKSIRNVAYNTNAQVIHNQITPQEGGYSVDYLVKSGADSAITIVIRNSSDLNHQVLPYSVSIAASEERWQEWFNNIPSVDERYQLAYAYAWWVMANNLISPLGNVAYEAMFPSKVNYIGLWLWDSAMHSLALRYIDPELARNQIRAMLAYQLPDGMLPDAIHDEGIVSEIDHPIRAEVTKPPILAWAALKLHEIDPDLEFLKEIYVPLVRWNAWWTSMNDDDADGLVQYNHPYSSGLDDNPLWDYGMPVESPDINTYLCVQMGSLAVIAEEIGIDVEGSMWRKRAEAIVRRMIEDFWDEQAGVFQALHEDQMIPVLTPFNLFPLWSGQLPDNICDRLIDHLTNPDEFWGEYIIPSVARNDPHYDPDRMWRGPVWVNINYFFIEALEQIGRFELAEEIREKTLELIMNQPSMFEYYNAETGEPPATAADIFGWTAAVFIDLAIKASSDGRSRKNPKEELDEHKE